ncbi:MAG: sulfite exporter TauE/SafE family protein [Bacteroidota bacterium]
MLPIIASVILSPDFLYPIFFLIALLYAMAGFGGGSSYLAILALTALPTGELRVMALVCNIIVAGGGVYHFARAGAIPWRRALPLVLCSVPAAYLGGRIHLPREYFLGLLGVVLLLAGLAMWWRKNAANQVLTEVPPEKPTKTFLLAAGLGGGLGFLAGVVSIGGGIFLSPFLFLKRWAAARAIAAVTSLFIFVNSLAGLAGQFSTAVEVDWQLLGWLALMVFIGGQLGTRLTIRKLSPTAIRRIAAVLIVAVGLRLLAQVAGML